MTATRRGVSPPPPRLKPRHLITGNCIVLSIILIAIAVGGWSVWRDYQQFLITPFIAADQPARVLNVPKGMNVRTLAQQLVSDQLMSHPHYFIALAYEHGKARSIKAGEYAIAPGMVPRQLLDRIVAGQSIQYSVTFIEGWRYRDALAAIARQPVFHSELSNQPAAIIAEKLGIDGDHPEGWLFPDTYYFQRGMTDTVIVRRAHQKMQRVLAAEWALRQPDLPLKTPYEALILASIIEKETGLARERPAIAGVFIRRLRLGMKLQTDPTVIYGLGDEYTGNLRRADLERDTPYNTYTRRGLPPTPIALPGRASLKAALKPQDDGSVYFVARGDGSHYFSKTLPEHQCAVRRYQLGMECDPRRYR
ncbi:endolytic transglycosylase MltG [Rhodoferax sp. 4810]|uniref:Endolytic murein transglycosylase n=1 Tax=Thiospirillum jenense TaxID=1653858 RepID=A0A839HJ65_9GAMM|nr:endolytic transglycosylase MltG [Thiospirillum jenense]MBB1076162.1 endolytic transglycosylase MltG [Rhodoferax jenense]MBB1126052.1 endolytic transglycosylase MltG [Thiospirillum jenense]